MRRKRREGESAPMTLGHAPSASTLRAAGVGQAPSASPLRAAAGARRRGPAARMVQGLRVVQGLRAPGRAQRRRSGRAPRRGDDRHRLGAALALLGLRRSRGGFRRQRCGSLSAPDALRERDSATGAAPTAAPCAARDRKPSPTTAGFFVTPAGKTGGGRPLPRSLPGASRSPISPA